MKIKISREIAYVLGMILIAIGTGTITRSNLGIGIVVAPAYMLHKWLSVNVSTFFTFGVCQYLFQALLLLVVCLVRRRFRLTYLFAFISAVLEGYLLDFVLYLIPDGLSNIILQILLFFVGQTICSLGIAFMLKTYITPEIYEVAVNEFTEQFCHATTSYTISVVKTIYDCASGALAIGMSFLFFHQLVGVGIGTIISALISGWMIGRFQKFGNKYIQFYDRLKIQKYFENSISE